MKPLEVYQSYLAFKNHFTKQENMENKVETLMKEKFLCPNKFAEEIEKLVLAYNFNYIDAI